MGLFHIIIPIPLLRFLFYNTTLIFCIKNILTLNPNPPYVEVISSSRREPPRTYNKTTKKLGKSQVKLPENNNLHRFYTSSNSVFINFLTFITLVVEQPTSLEVSRTLIPIFRYFIISFDLLFSK